MGWLFSRTTRDQLIRELNTPEETERSRREVVDHTLVDNVLWTVVRITAKQPGVLGLTAGEAITFIGCTLLDGAGDEWGYKSLDESAHPFYYSCPLRYLSMAPPVCAAWRELVRTFHANHPGIARDQAAVQ